MTEYRGTWNMILDTEDTIVLDAIISDDYDSDLFEDFESLPTSALPAYMVIEATDVENNLHLLDNIETMVVDERFEADCTLDGYDALPMMKAAEWADHIIVDRMSPQDIRDEFGDGRPFAVYDDECLFGY